MHLAASVCTSLVIVFACLTVKEVGGKRYAMILTGILLIWSGLDIFGSLYTYDDVSFVVWAGVFYLIARMLNGGNQRLWLLAGLLLGIGMLTKMTILFLGLAIFVSLWMVPERRWFRQPWIWLAALLAAACAIPYVLWQRDHGWYFLSYAASYAGRTTHASPIVDFVWNQLLPNNLATLPFWSIGLFMLVVRKEWARYRFFGFCYLVLLATLFYLGGQFYFMIPIYSVLIAVGATTIERWLEMRTDANHRRVAAKVAIPAAYLLLSMPMLPFFVPLLPPDLLIAYVRPLGVTAGVKTEDSQVTDLPQHVADRFGWEEMAGEVARVYRQTQGEVTGALGLAAGNWGEASALHLYGRGLGLPEPISTDGWFWFDGLRRDEWLENYVAIGSSESQLRSLFRHVERKAVFTNRYCRPNETNNPIYLCTHPKANLRAFWLVVYRMEPGFEEALRHRGVDEAVRYYHRRLTEDSTAILFTEFQMNRLGYAYLNRGEVKQALALFRLNIEAYPEAFNAYDSYGEALMADHQYDLAVRNYERSMELNPGNENGRMKLEELHGLIERQPHSIPRDR